MNYGDICEAETLGFSGEGRAIRVLKIGRFDGTRPLVFLEAGIHAREWIAPMTAVYLLQQLVENSDSHDLLDELDFIIIPVTNPDGYEYSHASVSDEISFLYKGICFTEIVFCFSSNDCGEKLEVRLLTALVSALMETGTFHISGDLMQT